MENYHIKPDCQFQFRSFYSCCSQLNRYTSELPLSAKQFKEWSAAWPLDFLNITFVWLWMGPDPLPTAMFISVWRHQFYLVLQVICIVSVTCWLNSAEVWHYYETLHYKSYEKSCLWPKIIWHFTLLTRGGQIIDFLYNVEGMIHFSLIKSPQHLELSCQVL